MLYKAELIRGFCHLAIGQETVSVGLEHGKISKDNRVITAYRCRPFAAMRGGAINGVLGELLGRRCGMSHGKGSSMHIFTPAFFGGNGIVGAFQRVLALRLLRSTVVKNIVCLHCTASKKLAEPAAGTKRKAQDDENGGDQATESKGNATRKALFFPTLGSQCY